MHAKELIGQWALRTKPTKTKWGHDDWSYCSSPFFIKNSTDTHVYGKTEAVFKIILDQRWVDDWVPYEPERKN